jgi:hypothetical protein
MFAGSGNFSSRSISYRIPGVTGNMSSSGSMTGGTCGGDCGRFFHIACGSVGGKC